MYDKASENIAYYTSHDRTKSIGYRGSDLVVDVAFMTTRGARHFLNAIKKLNVPNPGFKLVREVQCVPYTEILKPDDIVGVDHYVVGQFKSPPESFTSNTSAASVALPSSGMATDQSIEPKSCNDGSGFDKCHLKDKSECCSTEEKNNPNNMICLTPTPHRMFDGTMPMALKFRLSVLLAHSDAENVKGGERHNRETVPG